MSQNVKEYHGHPNYTLVYGILVALLGLSYLSDFIEAPIFAMTLLFGTAFIKAWLVISNFMHLKYEHWVMWLIPGSGVACLIILYVLVFPDAQLVGLWHEMVLMPY
ncbi:MAG: cytochrome C oxidase subunit IV family protein [Spirochaetia bacterium]|nr:cytochrome C oxidase subunit IV family protein [Spirochaetia bacterium]